MVIFRENSEDIYAGIEFENGTDDNKKLKVEDYRERLYGEVLLQCATNS